MIGYDKNLFILPFDHRTTFEKAGFEDIASYKQIIYEAFKKAMNDGIPPAAESAILVDEEHGDAILKDAKENNFTIALTVEKSGQEDFVFEYKDFEAHIEKYNPTFAKVLIRVQNGLSILTKNNLKKLSDYCHRNGPKLLVEIVSGGKLDLILKTITELQDLGVEGDVWKVEGMTSEEDYKKIVGQAKRNGREGVSIIILGRGEDKNLASKWIKAGSKIPGVIGFAVGRTIFWEPLLEFRDGKIKREEAIDSIAKNYQYFYNLFNE